MVKDYNWMLTDTAGDAVPDQSNPKVIIIDETPEGDEVSHHDRLLGNPFTGPSDMVAGPYGHGGALPPDHSQGSSNGGAQKEEFCTMVQTLEGIVALSTMTANNDPHSEVLSGGNFDVPQGGYPPPYFPENFQGLFIPKPEAPGILTCGYHHTSLRDHPLHCQGHSYTEGSDRVGMYPIRLGLVETGVGYTETMHVVRKEKARHHTTIRKYKDLFKHSGYQAAAVDTWGGLHFLPLIMSIFLSHHEKSSFVNQL